MKKVKRILASMLAIALLITMLPATVQATEGSQTTVESDSVTVEGTNGFGNLLSAEIQEEQRATEESGFSGGYSVIGLTIENGVATVEYGTLEEAILVVSLYTEDGLQLLISGTAVVKPEETVAEITLEGEMPAYFMASAYLLDTYDYSPLCSAYDTPMYTQEMQELLASTVEDYDADRVLNLDESTDTNFAVYSDTTKVIEYVDGVNTVASADDETATYVIENADENISGLQTGEVVAYPYGENEILIVKVASVSVDGTMVTITGDELEMEEVFSHVKIEGKGNTANVVVDDTTGDSGVIYKGLLGNEESVDPYGVATSAFEAGVEDELTLGFELDQTEEGIPIKGSLELKLELELCFYVSFSKQFCEVKFDTSVIFDMEISQKIPVKLIQLPCLGYAPFPGVYVGFEPELKIEFELKMNIIGTLSYTSGISYESGKGIQDLSTSPKLEIDVDVEGTCFFGIDMKPNVGIIGGKILKLTLSFLAGVEITSEMTGAYYDGTVVAGGEDNKKEVHDCDACLKTDIEGKIEISAGLEFLNWSFLKVELEVTTFTFRIGTCYYSFDRGEFGWGTCPHIAYRVTINILDDTNAGVSGVEVLSSSGEVWGCTNKHGVIIKYLPSGEYTMSAEVAGQEKTKTFTVSDACYVSLALADHLNNIGIGGIVNSETITDNNSIIASGECGDSAIWELNGNGLLTIKGSGKMTSAPWKQYAEDIRRVSIEYGVTSIYGSAFGNCSNVVSVSLSDSITSIGSWAFSNCESLEEINIPNSVTTINEGAFWFCKKLKSITIPSGVTRIDNHVFLQCNGLVTVNLPASITYIEEDAFWKCTSLKNVTIGSKVTSIGAEAFYDCSSLESISIPASVTSIGLGAFDGCAALKYINVDENNLFYMATDGVLYDQTGAALICAPAVGNVTIPDSVTSIDACAFRGNTNLHSINIPDNILTVGDSAFGECANLNTIVFSGDVPEFGSIPFHNVTATIYYPANNTTWTSDVMQDYGGTITWVSYTPTETATASVEQTGTIMATYSSSIVQAMSVFGGEYETEVQEEYVLKTASFSSLVPGEDYILLAMVSIEAEDVLSSDNLLYIDQGTAGEDGTLVFQYVQRVNTDTSYVMACGASDKDLSDATITFPEMYADSDIQAVEPTVVYDGETLVESKDYVIVGTVDYTEAGEYTCYIRGIYDYTGLVACTYTVDPARLTLAGANMVLGSTLDMNFFINKTDLSGTDYFAEITHYAEDGTTTTTVSYDQWDERTNYMVVTLENLAARQMADKIEVVIYNGNGTQVSEMWTDSIRDYAMRILENQDAETKTMLVDMLNYGAAAQTYFEYNTADLANNQLTTEQQAYATETASCTDQRVKGDNYYGSTLVLKNRIMLTMYFQNITTDMYAMVTFTDHKGVAHENCIEGSEFAKYNDTTYGVTVDDLVVADGDQLVTVTIYDGDSNVVAYASDTVNSYTGRMMSSDILFEQVAKFTTSAYAYFH